jgi:vancomycin resistance protein VanW
MKPVEKPIHRGALRTYLGKEYFSLKRKWIWWKERKRFAKQNKTVSFAHTLIEHQSLLLRPLKNVDMQLQHNKITNLRLAIAPIHRVVIEPGQTFSIWKLVGKPTRSKGYLDGLVLHNGQTGKGIGGGLCQLGNLLYWMALHTPLTVTERWRHSFDVFPDVNRTIPFACGATLSYNYVDLQLRNDTPHRFQINLWLDDTHLHGAITCSEKLEEQVRVVESDHQIVHQFWGGYTRHNRIWKEISSEGNTRRELVAENSAIMMYNPLLEK